MSQNVSNDQALTTNNNTEWWVNEPAVVVEGITIAVAKDTGPFSERDAKTYAASIPGATVVSQ